MKKRLIFIVCFLIGFLTLVQGQIGMHEPGTGIEDPEMKLATQGTGQGQRVVAQSGNYLGSMGKQMNVYRQTNQFMLEVGGVSADCPFNLTQETFENRTRLYAGLSNGRDAEIKFMPDVASEMALQRLRLKNCTENCTIELREVGLGNQTRIAYEIQAQRNSRVFGLFGARMDVSAQVDAETGEVIDVKKPWWAFLATESEE